MIDIPILIYFQRNTLSQILYLNYTRIQSFLVTEFEYLHQIALHPLGYIAFEFPLRVDASSIKKKTSVFHVFGCSATGWLLASHESFKSMSSVVFSVVLNRLSVTKKHIVIISV